MKAQLLTFPSIFHSTFENEKGLFQINKIVIPFIQRDYAQGRMNPETIRVRKRFLDALYQAVTEKPIILDFVYGDIDQEGVLIPLDGQQRLTTLFLLYWYAAKKEKASMEDTACLSCFSYETRYSARAFCKALADFSPGFDQNISEEIMNQAWFPLDWKNDPTISGMLIMIDAIHEKFGQMDNLWNKLEEKAIQFYFLPIEDIGTNDELYITMNSRGKPLTDFEHFKAEFEKNLQKIDEDLAKRISMKIDTIWTDLLWNYRGTDHTIDEAFLNYFRFICDIIQYQKGKTPYQADEFDLIEKMFSGEDALQHALTIEKYFDCWCQLKEKPAGFFNRYYAVKHEKNKITIQGDTQESRPGIDILRAACLKYTDKKSRQRGTAFPLKKLILLYANIFYLQHQDKINEEAFIRRIRMVNNLISNSENEISDNENSHAGNRLPAILKQVDAIMLSGKIDFELPVNFSKVQLKEEAEKIEWGNAHPEKVEELFALEDNPLLYGQIGILGLENDSCFKKFGQLFNLNWAYADRALMVTGFYGQQEKDAWRYQLGSVDKSNPDPWKNLFHHSGNKGFGDTKKVLVQLLSALEEINEVTINQYINQFLDECESKKEYPWRYYYVKYSAFRPKKHCKYFNYVGYDYPYCFLLSENKTRFSDYKVYNPLLKEAFNLSWSFKSYNGKVYCKNYSLDRYFCVEKDGFSISKSYWDLQDEKYIKVPQNEKGIDTENRIEILKKYIRENGLNR